eukprot:6473023-Amphidinium_carterae.1
MTRMAVTPSQTPQATPREFMQVDEGLQTVVHQWQTKAAQQMETRGYGEKCTPTNSWPSNEVWRWGRCLPRQSRVVRTS